MFHLMRLTRLLYKNSQKIYSTKAKKEHRYQSVKALLPIVKLCICLDTSVFR